MTPPDYIASAKKLLTGPVSNVDARRAVSAAYYAMFHQICSDFTTFTLGRPAVGSPQLATGVYRSVDHRPTKNRCNEALQQGLAVPAEIARFARTFVVAQERRLTADYDPAALVSEVDAINAVDAAESSLIDYDAVPDEARHAFVVFICLPARVR